MSLFPVIPRLEDEIFAPVTWTRSLWDPLRDLSAFRNSALNTLASASGDSHVQETDKDLRILCNLKEFRPEEVTVTSDNKTVTITAKHEEKEDRQDKYSFVSRQITRRYCLPENVDHKSVTSTMNKDGVLQIHADKLPPAVEAPKEFVIPVEFKK